MRGWMLIGLLVVALGAVGVAAWLVLAPGDAPLPTGAPPTTVEKQVDLPPVLEGMAPVAGRVEDEAGEPVTGVTLYLLAPGDALIPKEEPHRGRTDEEGRFALQKPRAEARDLFAFRPGYRPTMVGGVGESRDLRVVLVRGGEIRGRIVDDAGRPVIGARVTARTSESEIDPPKGVYLPFEETLHLTWVRTISGLGGSFVLRGVGEGEMDVWAEKRGYPEPNPRRSGVAAGGDPLNLVLLRPFVAEVSVRDADSAEAMFRISVKVELPGDEKSSASGETDHTGVCRISLGFPAARAPETRVSVRVYAEGYGEEVTEGVPLDRIEEGKGFTFAIAKRAPAKLRVRVRYDTGQRYSSWVGFKLKPRAGAEIFKWSRLDSDGFANLKINAGTYQHIHVRLMSGKDAPFLENVVFRPGEEVERSHTVVRGGDLNVTCRAEGGAGIRFGELKVVGEGFEVKRRVWGGRVHVRDLPAGTSKLTIDWRDFETVTREITIVRDEHLDLEIQLTKKK